MTKTKTHKLTTSRVLYICSVLLVILFLIYMYLVSASVMHVVIREENRQEGEKVKSEISNLETRLISRQHIINEEVVAQYGFKKNAKKIFIDRTPDTLVLSSQTQ